MWKCPDGVYIHVYTHMWLVTGCAEHVIFLLFYIFEMFFVVVVAVVSVELRVPLPGQVH